MGPVGTKNQQVDDVEFRNRQKPCNLRIESYDIGRELGLPVSHTEDSLHLDNEMNDEEYREHMRLQIPKQLEYAYNTVNQIKITSKPFHGFLSRSAGVGKSSVTMAIHQTALKFLRFFSTRTVLVTAPEEKAAYHVRG